MRKPQQEIVDQNQQTAENVFIASMYQMEIDRVQYMLGAYLRTRLFKVGGRSGQRLYTCCRHFLHAMRHSTQNSFQYTVARLYRSSVGALLMRFHKHRWPSGPQSRIWFDDIIILCSL